jgi:hypothetical protein
MVSCSGKTSPVSPTGSSANEEITPQISNEEVPVLPTTSQVATFSDNLWVKIDSPVDGAVVNVPEMEMTGTAAIGTTLTINDDILYLESDEHFSDDLVLIEGENLIEIIGSDAYGNEVSIYITVYCEP